MIIREIPLLEDNYGYVLMDEETKQAAVIDPVEPKKVLAAAKSLDANITIILTTHKHWDHAGGNQAMAKQFPNLPILGGAIDQVEACTRTLQDGDEFTIGKGIKVQCLHTPGHTLGHICYYVTSSEEKAVFTGDTLFIGGAGKFFEGTPAQMYASLTGKLARLPPETKVYCGHEYTLSNYKFAEWLEPNNAELKKAAEEARTKRQKTLPTIPSTIGHELATNPFLRVDQPAVVAKVQAEKGEKDLTHIDILAYVREMKNSFRG